MFDITKRNPVALLIDADNVQSSYIPLVLKLCEYYGELEICRAYGDWETPQLVSQCENYDALNIDRKQVPHVGKNATDHGLLLDAGQILGGNGFFESDEYVFIIVSGDGDFASASELIKAKGHQIIGIGNREKASSDLCTSCETYYFLEDLEETLKNLEKHCPTQSELRAFFYRLQAAYKRLDPNEKWTWVRYSQLGDKLHELDPDYENHFGKFALSDWLRNFEKYYECQDQMVRRIDPDPEFTRLALLLKAYLQTKRSDGMASLADLGKALREHARDYEEQFGGRKLSEWFKAYSDTFKLEGNCVTRTDRRKP